MENSSTPPQRYLDSATGLSYYKDNLFKIAEQARVEYGFFTRNGGVSEGEFKSLNHAFNSGDAKENIISNREKVSKYFSKEGQIVRLITPQQHHSNEVRIITDTNLNNIEPCDGLVTNLKNLAIGVLTADCAPVLFYEAEKQIIAAVHAGWRGAFSDIIDNTIDAIEELGGTRSNVFACIGPCISQACYEVDVTFKDKFLAKDTSYHIYFKPGKDEQHFYFDLARFIFARLLNKGITATNYNLCTFTLSNDFFSYRRSYLAGKSDYGRQISAIMLK